MSTPPPQGRRFPPQPGGNRRQVTVPPGGIDTIANEQITATNYAEFMTDLSLAYVAQGSEIHTDIQGSNGAMQMMQASKILNTMHQSISLLHAPTAEQGQCKTCFSGPTEGNIRTARAPRVRFYQPFPAFFTFFQGGKDAVA